MIQNEESWHSSSNTTNHIQSVLLPCVCRYLIEYVPPPFAQFLYKPGTYVYTAVECNDTFFTLKYLAGNSGGIRVTAEVVSKIFGTVLFVKTVQDSNSNKIAEWAISVCSIIRVAVAVYQILYLFGAPVL